MDTIRNVIPLNKCAKCHHAYSNKQGRMVKDFKMSKATGAHVNVMVCPKCWHDETVGLS